MSNAAAALRIARTAGVHVALDGADLALETGVPPPSDLLDLLAERKADIVKLLQRQDDDAPGASPLVAAFEVLERRCPAHVEPADWRQAVADGRRFLAQWA